jgi:predicted phage gp36 major capsid-like protein
MTIIIEQNKKLKRKGKGKEIEERKEKERRKKKKEIEKKRENLTYLCSWAAGPKTKRRQLRTVLARRGPTTYERWGWVGTRIPSDWSALGSVRG